MAEIRTAAEAGGDVSLNRYATRKDANQGAIIKALEDVGIHVWVLDSPVDLLLWWPRWGPGNFRLLEVKCQKGKLRNGAQRTFVETTGTPVVRTPLEALKAVGAFTPVPILCAQASNTAR